MTRVLHLLPHPGGGGELHVDLLGKIPGTSSERLFVSASRSPARALAGLPLRGRAIARAADGADLVHAHGDMSAAICLRALRARPSVWTTHGLSFLRRSSGPPNALFRRRLRAVIAAAGATICTTEAERRELLDLADPADGERLVVVPNGLPLPAPADPERRARLRASLDLAPEHLVALFAGRLDEPKGARDAVAAAALARREGAPLTLLVAGDGPLAGELSAQAGEGVRLLGHRDDVHELLGAADAFVLPSRREGSSYAVIEALGAGLAVVVCDGLGNPETVGDAGVVVPCGDVPALARVLASLAREPGRRQALGAAARARAEGALGEQRFLRDVAAVYDAVGASALRIS